MKQLTAFQRHLTVALVLAAGASCSASIEVVSERCVDTLDSDGDGLSDCEERELGTALHLSDTDGDGISDFEEVVEYGFSPEEDVYSFNPRIADTPKFRIEMSGPPNLSLMYANSYEERIAAQSQHDTDSNDGAAQPFDSNSLSVEYAETVGGAVRASSVAGFPSEVNAGATVSYRSAVATTSATAHTWTPEQIQENSQTLSNAIARVDGNDLKLSSGALNTTFRIINEGTTSFTLLDIELSALMTTPGLENMLSPVGTLFLGKGQTALAERGYQPGQESAPIEVSGNQLDIDIASSVLSDSTAISLRVDAYELVDSLGRSFTQQQDEVSAHTATIVIDYNQGLESTGTHTSERFQVATAKSSNEQTTTAGEVMQGILHIPFAVDDAGALYQIRDLAFNDRTFGRWVAIHRSSKEDGRISHLSQRRADYDFAALELEAGDLLHLIYVEDSDGDGRGARLQALSGSDARNSGPGSDSAALRSNFQQTLRPQ